MPNELLHTNIPNFFQRKTSPFLRDSPITKEKGHYFADTTLPHTSSRIKIEGKKNT